MKILGTKFFGHDNAVFYLDTDKKYIFAVSLERLTRIKHDRGSIRPLIEEYPFLLDFDFVSHGYNSSDSIASYQELLLLDALKKKHSPKYVKELSNIKNNRIKRLGLYTSLGVKPVTFFIGKMLSIFSKSIALTYACNRIDDYYSRLLRTKKSKIKRFDHHLCHAFSAYVFSPHYKKNQCISLTLDGFGDGYFSKLYIFDAKGNNKLIGSSSTNEGHGTERTSIGLMYSAFTRALGLIPDSDEGKVEARAAFASADKTLLGELHSLIRFQELDIVIDRRKNNIISKQKYLINQKIRLGDEVFAATIQTWLEDTVVNYLNIVYEKTKINKLCLSGGVVANIIMSLNLYERTSFRDIYIFPAMADDGVSAGGALLIARENGLNLSWLSESYYMPYFGKNYSRLEVSDILKEYQKTNQIIIEDLANTWPEVAGESVACGKIIAIFHGREEFGPRALGNRSIVANPTEANTKDRINSSIKRRPHYQPFCPSILEEERERLFEESFSHKHMAIAFRMKKEFWEQLPSAIHVDGTARPQFVERNDNLNYYRLIEKVKKKTGFGVVLNTSFNLHGRAMVHKPVDAVRDFIDCGMDELYIEGYKVTRR